MSEEFSRRTFLHHAGVLTLCTFLSPRLVLLGQSQRRGTSFVLSRTKFSMGSVAEITVYGENRAHCITAMENAFAAFDEVEKLMSVFNAQSQLSMVNRLAGKREVQVDELVVEVLTSAHRYHQVTNGAFDVTVEPLMRMYGFRDEQAAHRFPSDAEISETLDGVGMSKVTIVPQRSTVVLEHEKTRLDLGGIAVGYAIDRAVEILTAEGIESALINHSGDIFALGAPPEEEGWEVGIINPFHTQDIFTSVRIKDKALSTSGNYRNFIKVEGRIIGHLLDPRTGNSASSLLSGTTIADTAIEADALSTGFFILGIEQSKSVLPKLRNVQFIALVQNGEGMEVEFTQTVH